MDNWQNFFVNASIFGFIFQILLVITVFQITKNFSSKKYNKEILEKLYEMDYFSINHNKNIKF